MAVSRSRRARVPLDWLYPSGTSIAASRSKPISTSSRSVIGRTPLSLMSNSTRFSQVDCIRSISKFGILMPASRLCILCA